jgi:hypothetical protein
VDFQAFGGAQKVTVVPADDLEDKTLLELFHGFGKKDPLVDHLGAKGFEAILEPGL